MASKKKTPKKRAGTGARKGAAKRPFTRKKSAGPARGKVRRGRTAKRPSPQGKRRPLRPSRPVRENPEALALARAIAGVADSKKAIEVTILDVRARGWMVGYDYIVLATGESDRQLSAIAEAVDDLLRPQARRATSVKASPDWVAMDYDDVVVHFFTPEKRALYDFEGMWTDAPRVKVSG